jgi:two-component system invasion response regulator UvrY
MQAYLRHLKSDGVLAVHITNRYLDLRPVIAAAAEQLGISALIFDLDPAAGDRFCRHSVWVVMDLSMEGFGGIEAIRRIREIDPRAGILVYTVHNSQVLLERALEAGALGFVTKGSNVDALLLGLKKVARGESFVSSDMVPALLDRHRSSGISRFNRLTQREFQVFKLLSEGHTLPECASTLHLSPKTVSNHFTQIRAKLGVSSPAEMARMAIRQGLVEP